jgi:hypothetical protein
MSSIDGDKIQWPDFTELGDLPVRVHRAKIAEVISYFGGGTSQRVAVTARLERIYGLARGTGHLQRFIVFGSYVTMSRTHTTSICFS